MLATLSSFLTFLLLFYSPPPPILLSSLLSRFLSAILFFFFFSSFFFSPLGSSWHNGNLMLCSLQGGGGWQEARAAIIFTPSASPRPCPARGTGAPCLFSASSAHRDLLVAAEGGQGGGRKKEKTKESSGFCYCRGWIAMRGASSFTLPAFQPSPRSGYNNALLFGTLSVARISAGARRGLKLSGRGGSRRACSSWRLGGVSFCVFLGFRGSHFLCVPGRPSGTEEVRLWAQETLGRAVH